MIARIGYVAIGRNEGDRLKACLSSLHRDASAPIVYVDSGSDDDSVAVARSYDAEIVALNLERPFTAARARNAGARRLIEIASTDYIQFIDGDCALDSGWAETARAFLDSNDDVAVVCGRRRERRPRASVYNRLCDIEWDTPIGETLACGGDAMMRRRALEQAGFYDERLIAGEEPELCVRLREKGWKIRRLDAEMTLHDAAMSKFGQWWKRSARAGHAFAEVSRLHRKSAFGIWKRETARAFFWSAIAPIALLLALTAGPWAAMLLAAYPIQIARLGWGARERLGDAALPWAFFTVIGKFPEAVGALRYHAGRLVGRRARLVEYK